jgi:hypothetical protein
MRLRGKLVGELTYDDLKALLDGRVPESRELDYKAAPPDHRDSGKRELLADVCAFANTLGGVLLYGVATERDEAGHDTGIPCGLPGIGAVNVDDEKRWIT